tara:strand:+ start:577 stop:1062 length:486 start_codon:yes stop_codon:yes gene_type:complete
MDDPTTLRSWRTQKPGEVRSEHTREVVVHELAEGYDERLAALEEQMRALSSLGHAFDGVEARVKVLEARPVVEAPGNDAVAVPAAFGHLVEQVGDIDSRMRDLDAGLANDVADLTATSLKMFSMLQQEQDLVRRRVNKVNDDMTDFMDGLKQWTAQEKQRA